eukprot:gene17357-biopygen20372
MRAPSAVVRDPELVAGGERAHRQHDDVLRRGMGLQQNRHDVAGLERAGATRLHARRRLRGTVINPGSKGNIFLRWMKGGGR